MNPFQQSARTVRKRQLLSPLPTNLVAIHPLMPIGSKFLGSCLDFQLGPANIDWGPSVSLTPRSLLILPRTHCLRHAAENFVLSKRVFPHAPEPPLFPSLSPFIEPSLPFDRCVGFRQFVSFSISPLFLRLILVLPAAPSSLPLLVVSPFPPPPFRCPTRSLCLAGDACVPPPRRWLKAPSGNFFSDSSLRNVYPPQSL